MTIALVSKRILLPFVNLSEDDDRFDKILERLVVASSEQIQHYLNRELEYKQRTIYLRSYEAYADDPDPQLLWLGAYPVDAVSPLSLRYSPTRDWDNTPDLQEGSQFLVDLEKGLLRVFSPSCTAGDRTPSQVSSGMVSRSSAVGFRLTYTAGFKAVGTSWPVLEVPDTIATATALQTAFYFHAHSRGSLGLDTAGGDNPNASKSRAEKTHEGEVLIPEVRMILRPFVRRGALLGRSY